MQAHLASPTQLFEIRDFVPFDPSKKHSPTIYVLSEGGHGGYATLQFCPFCGKQFPVKQNEN